jgi:hypothetical protein
VQVLEVLYQRREWENTTVRPDKIKAQRGIWLAERPSSHPCEDAAGACLRDVGRLPPEARPGEDMSCREIKEAKPLERHLFSAMHKAVKEPSDGKPRKEE